MSHLYYTAAPSYANMSRNIIEIDYISYKFQVGLQLVEEHFGALEGY